MNQMNEAHRRKLRAQEFENWGEVRGSMKKVQTLVERAYKTDPRVAAYRREQERLQEEKEVSVWGVCDGREWRRRSDRRKRSGERRNVWRRRDARGRRRRVCVVGRREEQRKNASDARRRRSGNVCVARRRRSCTGSWRRWARW